MILFNGSRSRPLPIGGCTPERKKDDCKLQIDKCKLQIGEVETMSDVPLTRSQQALRGRKICDMSIDQLRDWIDACNKMERHVIYNKGRRSWTRSRSEAEAELERRISESSE